MMSGHNNTSKFNLYLYLFATICISFIYGAPQNNSVEETTEPITTENELLTTVTKSTTHPETVTKLDELKTEPFTVNLATEPSTTKITASSPKEFSTHTTPETNETTVNQLQDTDQTTRQQKLISPITIQQNGSNHLKSSLAEIKENTLENDADGGYHFSFIASDGTKRQEKGVLKEIPNDNNTGSELTVITEGSYSYVSPHGKTYEAHYIADENGFRVNFTLVSPSP